MRRWKLLGAIVLSLLALLASFTLWIRDVATRRWAEMDAIVQNLQKDAEARIDERPVLLGPAEPGDAWIEYRVALDSVGQGHFYGPPNRIWMEALRRGARKNRAQGQFPKPEVSGWTDRSMGHLTQAAEAWIRRDMDRMKYRACLEVALDLAQFGADVARDGDLQAAFRGLDILRTAYQALKDLLSGGLSSEDIADLAQALDRLDEAFPDLTAIAANETMAMGSKFLTSRDLTDFRDRFAARDVYGEPPVVRIKRALLPGRLLMAEAFHLEWDLRRREIAVLTLPWSKAKSALDDVREEFATAHGVTRPVHGSLGRALFNLPEDHRRGQAYLRLLRAASRYIVEGKTPELADPFGERLIYRVKDGRLRIWSVGPDGVDDGGDSAGESPWKPNPQGRQPRDLVLEVRR